MYSNYDEVKENLIVRLCNAEMHQKDLESIPHKTVGDIALMYAVKTPLSSGRHAYITVTDDMLKDYNVSEETLEHDAFKSCVNGPADICPLPVVLFGLVPGDAIDEGSSKNAEEVLVVTNKEKEFGASVLFNPGVMEKLSETYSEFYALPSSVHEWLVLPANDYLEVEALSQMVKDVNRTAVEEKDFLSDHVYHYTRETGLTIAD